jgi:transposase InsO family protein
VNRPICAVLQVAPSTYYDNKSRPPSRQQVSDAELAVKIELGFDNFAAEGFFGTLQWESLDQHHWETRRQLAQTIFEWIEAGYKPSRRHSYCAMVSPVAFEAVHGGHAESAT